MYLIFVSGNSGNSKSKTKKTKKKKNKKPKRPCPICPELDLQSSLKRHLIRKHNKDVSHILTMSPRKQYKEFLKFRNDGIIKYNKKLLSQSSKEELMRARSQSKTGSTRVCNLCKTIISRNIFSRHKCTISTIRKPKPLDIECFINEDPADQEFNSQCVNHLADDKIGKLIKADRTLLFLGSKLFRRTNKEKKVERRNRTNGFMRRVAIIYDKFLIVRKKDSSNFKINLMFRTEEIDAIGDALRLALETGRSLANLYYNNIRMAIDLIQSQYLNSNETDKYNEIERFRKSFANLWKEEFKSYAEDVKRESNKRKRTPNALPTSSDIKTLIDHCERKIECIKTVRQAANNFVQLRRCIYTLLTIDNSRRGGELSRLKINNVKEDLQTSWSLPGTSSSSKDKIYTLLGKTHLHSLEFVFLKNYYQK